MDRASIRDQFDAAAPGYGHGWHASYAQRLVDATPLVRGQRVLDVATGTGLAAFAACRTVGSTGRVVGIDIALGMVAEAKRRAAVAGVENVEFAVADAESLPFDAASFDAVLCSSAIVYLPLPAALAEWRRVLRPGGAAAFSTLTTDSPRTGVVFRKVAAAFGVDLANPNAIGDEATCRALMASVGFSEIEVATGSLAPDPMTRADAWRAASASAAFAAVRRLPASLLARMESAYHNALTDADLVEPHHALFVIGRSSPTG